MLISYSCNPLPIFRCQLDEKMAYDTKYRELKALENQLKGMENMFLQGDLVNATINFAL